MPCRTRLGLRCHDRLQLILSLLLKCLDLVVQVFFHIVKIGSDFLDRRVSLLLTLVQVIDLVGEVGNVVHQRVE